MDNIHSGNRDLKTYSKGSDEMPAKEEKKQKLRNGQKKLVQSLIISVIFPWILYTLIRRFFTNDAAPLAITAAIPIVRTMYLWFWRHRVDFIGLVGIFSFTIGVVASALSGGSSLPLKLIHPIVFGTIGLIFLVSASIGKPLLLMRFPFLNHGNTEHLNSPLGRKKFTIMTIVFGCVSLINSAVHIFMALTLPTSAYVAMSHMVSWITILVLITSGKLIMRRVK